VKWFEPEKGFGFVQVEDGSSDAFLHVRAVQAAGHEALPPGARLKVRVAQGQKGPQVTEILSVDLSTADPNAASRPRSGPPGGARPARPPRAAPGGPTEEVEGVVKWYNTQKGFGFIGSEQSGKDIFVHATALERSGLSALAEGQRVIVQVAEGAKGPEARSIRVAD
jgi:CspA family cold shock protein